MGSDADELNGSDVENDDEVMDDGEPGSKLVFQKTVWTLGKLPYSAEIEAQADEHFRVIKSGFAHSVLLKDIRRGMLHYCTELDKYISLHSYRFTKEDHVALLRLLTPFIKKGEIYRDVRVILRVMTSLLKKKDCLTRNDITFDWRPVFALYEEVAYGNLEEDGVFLMPEGFKDDITKFIRVAREFWPLEATQQILDEFRPLLCPWDESMLKGMKMLQMFLPTVMTREEHAEFGAGLWFEEIWHHFLSIQSNSLVEPYQVHLFTRVSRDCPGLISWADKLNLMFSKLTRSLRLGRGLGFNQVFPVQNATVWMVYMIGVEKEAQVYLTRLMTLCESFLHPSNYGSHSSHLLNLLYRLVNEMVSRIKRERSAKCTIPEELRLTEETITGFVTSLLPCVKLAIFTKVKQEYISYIIKNLALLAPKIVLPAILEIVYPALETVTEPHRLTQSLSCLFVALIPMLREEAAAGERTRKAEMIVLLEALLPAIDPNDIKKTLLCFQVFGIMVNTAPLVDCSEAIHLRDDLTEDEKEICSATANFEGLTLGMMDKIMGLLDWGANGAAASGHGSLAKNSHKFNIEEHVLHDGVRMVYKGIVMNSSRQIYELAANRLYQFVAESLYDSHVVASTVSEIISLTVRARPELSFARFLSLISKKLHEAITPDSYEEEKVNFTITYWLSLASGLFRVQAPFILQHADEIKAIIRLILPIKCSIGINFACKTLQRVLRSVTLCYQDTDRAALAAYDLPLDQHLPIRSWAARLDRKAYDTAARWFVPTQQSIDFAREILDEHLTKCLEKIANPAALSKQELFHEMLVVLSSMQGASFSLPAFDSPIVRVNHMPTFIEVSPVVTRPAGTPELTLPEGQGTVRGRVLAAMERLLPFLMSERESEVKVISAFISIISTLVFSRGSDKSKLQQIISTHRIARLMMGDRLYGTVGYIKALAEESINVAHQNRVQHVSAYHLTEEHKRIIEILAQISISSYALNRRPAQQILSRVLREFPYSFTLVMDDILKALEPEAATPHAQLKGALYMLIDGKRLALVLRQNWEMAARVWPALVRMKHSERPSIIRLLETAQNTIVDSFESYRITELVPDPSVDALAVALLEVGKEGRHAAKYGVPDEQKRAEAAAWVKEQNEKNERSYNSLVRNLLAGAADSSLHWRHTDLAQVFISILIRRDVSVDPDCVRLFLRLCIHDSLKTRKMAVSYIGAWLKINKPLAVKRPYQPKMMEPNRSPGAKWPITYGIRKDNLCMQYDEASLPSNAAEWEQFPFVGKMHWGFYCWPKELKTYAPVAEQAAINRPYEQLSEIEKHVVDTLKDPEYAARFRELFSIEEKKGEDKFNVVTFSLFLGLFRSYNDLLLPTFVEHMEALVAKDEAGATKLATEMLAGIVNGSKMWRFEKVESMWKWLAPFLTRVLSNLKDNAQRNWGTAIAAICGSSESRMLQPLLNLLFELTLRPSDNCFMTAARLFLLQSALCQFEWRCLQLWNRLAPTLIAQLAQPYTNIRDRVASSLVTLTWFDLAEMSNDPEIPAEFRPFKTDAVLDSFDALLNEAWEEARRGESAEGGGGGSGGSNGSAAPSASASSVSLCSMNGGAGGGESEGRKASRLALKSLTQFIFTYGAQTLGETSLRILNYMPLLAHFSTLDLGDDELRNNCASTLRDFLSSIFVPAHKAGGVVELFEKFLSAGYSWKVRMVLIGEISTLVFSNSYAFDAHRERVGRLIAAQMADDRLEVRESAADAISLFIHSGYLPVTEALIAEFIGAVSGESLTLRHSGVLGLCSIVQAFPYSVPSFMPEILAFLCRHGREKEPIKETIKKALAEFKRTHQDCWHEHKEMFTEDQLVQLTDFLVSPNYYV